MSGGLLGQTTATIEELNLHELVLGDNTRSCGQFDIWEATFAPLNASTGYPQRLWDKRTGVIDKSVAEAMRTNGYDLRDYVERNWATIGPRLVGKLHVAVGDMDNYFLNLGVYRFETFLESTKEPGKGPYYAGKFDYGRPLKPHGWQPWSNQELLRIMDEQVRRNAPRP